MATYQKIYNYILDLIENEFEAGDRLPGARQIAKLFSCALPKVQAVLNSLEQSGVVECRERSGTYVREGFGQCLLPCNIACYRMASSLSEEQLKTLQREFPSMHVSSKFSQGGVEIAPSLDIQIRQQNFLDVNSVFEECFPDYREKFYMQSLEPFKRNGRLYAVPLVFSPQLLWYNPVFFEKYNVPLPRMDWGEKEFFEAMRSFKEHLPGRDIVNYSPSFYQWMGFLHSAGGRIFGLPGQEPVQVDSPATISISRTYVELLKEFGLDRKFNSNAVTAFAEGKMPMFVGFKDNAKLFKKHNPDFVREAVYMPQLGGAVNYQGVMLIAFRKFNSRDIVKRMLKFWLSDEVQESLGRDDCGIPILRSAAQKSLDPGKSPDSLFLKRLPNLCSDYNIDSEETGSVVMRASKLLNTGKPDDMEKVLRDMATTLRFLMRLRAK